MKKIMIVMLMVIASLTLIACGNGDRGGNKGARIVEWYELSEDADYDGSKVTIKFWHRMGEDNQKLVQKWIKEFNVEYPNITVIESKEANNYEELADKIALQIPTKNYPDIAESYPDHVARFASAKVPLALNTFISNPNIGYTQEEIDDFLPGLWNEGKSYDLEGSIMSLPYSKSSEALFYNATYFEEKGYEVPRTWDEVFAIAQQIKDDDPSAIPFGYDSEDNLFIGGSEQWGAPYTGYNEQGVGQVLFNNAKSKEMALYFKEKVEDGLMITRQLNGNAYTSDIMKTNTKLYMYVGSTGGTRYAYSGAESAFGQGYRVGVSTVPVKDMNNRKQIQQGPNIALFNKGNEQQMIAAWLFSKFMLEPERQAELSTTSGYAASRKSAYETATWKAYEATIKENPTTLNEATAKLIKEAIEMFLENGDVFFTSAVFNLGSATRNEVGSLLAKVLAYKPTGTTKAEKAADLERYVNEEFLKSYNFIIN